MKTIVVEVPDELWEILEPLARKQGIPVERYILDMMLKVNPPRPQLSEEERQKAREKLLRFAGAVASGDPRSADNERIDADLAREYGSSHEEKG
ncbi:MAG: hypothetical protein NZ749_01605 [bacterium]|nr:hypothetical protein [bacterium]